MPKEMWGPDKYWKTKAKFFSWLRGGLRRGVWNKHIHKLNLKKEKRYKAPIGVGGRDVWAFVCEDCGKEKRESEAEVDHIIPAGKLNDASDIQGFVERLAFVEAEDLRLLCKSCNSIRAYSDRYGVSLEEAKKRKAEIAKKKGAK